MSESLVTRLTLMRFHANVDKHVLFEASSLSERLVAFSACEIFLSCHVSITAALIATIDGLFVIAISF